MNTERLRNLATCLTLMCAFLLAPSLSSAQDLSLKPEHVPPSDSAAATTETQPSDSKRPRLKSAPMWRNVGLGAAGVATAFLVHETGHVLMNFLFGNVPTLSKTSFGPFPFFTIDPGIRCTDSGCFKIKDGSPFRAGRPGKYFITAGGFLMQNAITEVILTRDPKIRFRYKPFQKGMLLFYTALSMGYAVSAWAKIEPPTGDIDGMSNAAQINKNVMAVMVALPAVFDVIRYMRPDWNWAPWVGRFSKVALVGVAVTF